eukprot:TRINITY_DN8733_c0_g1_i3.p4 TRINITY_DN8733_c0_g1~~TRINITY_DN8733_c0_g1_i3.p4  ORF type:complete len:112 (-),score=11.77 TRINITY_DN8733_c0_g1_i3:49-384(-)
MGVATLVIDFGEALQVSWAYVVWQSCHDSIRSTKGRIWIIQNGVLLLDHHPTINPSIGRMLNVQVLSHILAVGVTYLIHSTKDAVQARMVVWSNNIMRSPAGGGEVASIIL